MPSRAPRTATLLALPLVLPLVLALVLAVGGTGPARAAEVKTTNACYSSFETRNRDLDMTISGTAGPGTGGTVTLSALSVSSGLPDFMPVFGYNLGILQSGRNEIAANVHVAVAGSNTVESVQVLDADLTATTTVTDPDGTPGTGDETATPVAVTVALPDSSWTPSGSGPIEFTQALPGALPEVAGAGPAGAVAKPRGSIFVGATIGPAKLNFDCVPGTTDLADLARITPSTPAAFASAAGAASTPTTVTAAGAAEEGSSDDGGGLPVVVLGAGALAVLVAGGVVLSRRRPG